MITVNIVIIIGDNYDCYYFSSAFVYDNTYDFYPLQLTILSTFCMSSMLIACDKINLYLFLSCTQIELNCVVQKDCLLNYNQSLEF